jgi:hypothetical protein
MDAILVGGRGVSVDTEDLLQSVMEETAMFLFLLVCVESVGIQDVVLYLLLFVQLRIMRQKLRVVEGWVEVCEEKNGITELRASLMVSAIWNHACFGQKYDQIGTKKSYI